MCHEKEGKGKITEAPRVPGSLCSLSLQKTEALFLTPNPFSHSYSPFRRTLSLWLILKIQNESGFSIYQRRRLRALPPGRRAPWDNSQWGMRSRRRVGPLFSSQEHLTRSEVDGSIHGASWTTLGRFPVTRQERWASNQMPWRLWWRGGWGVEGVEGAGAPRE